jgi:8-oxo-dGTP pyrophosphatase MutT (NUDIX family)
VENDFSREIMEYMRGHDVEHADIVNRVVAQPFPCDRSTAPGHITASAFNLDASRQRVLLIHHAGLNLWLQPGGHIDAGELTLNAAIREAWEEVGLRIKPITSSIIDLESIKYPLARKSTSWHIGMFMFAICELHRKMASTLIVPNAVIIAV